MKTIISNRISNTVKVLLITAFLSSGIIANGQNVSTYTFAQTAGTYTAIATGTTAMAGLQDDLTGTIQNIGFNFSYHGTVYTTFGVQSNGYITLGSVPTQSYTALSSVPNAIAFANRDGKTNGAVIYAVSGTAPNRVLTIQFPNWYLSYSVTTNTINAQIKLYETTNVIEVVYGTSAHTVSYPCYVGLTGAAVTDFSLRTTATNWAASTTSANNTSTMAWTATVFPASGQIYRWSPPVIVAVPLCAATPTSPTNGQTGVATSPTLTWAAVTNATSYDIYLGTAASPPFVINTASTTYSPAALAANTLYYWKIIPKNAIGAATGCSTWSFTTTTPGCTNTSSYGTVTAPTNNTITTISTCQYQTEYSTINSAVAGSTYQSAYNIAGTYITVHQGTYNGPIIAYGLSPLNWTPAASGTYFVHYNTNSGCGTASTCGTSTIQCTTCAGCVTPGTPTSLSGTATGSSTATISWAAGSPAGSATITYYYSVYTSTGTYVTGSSTASTSASITGLACGTSYYFTVYASTSCNSTSSLTATSSNFTSGACPPPPANDLVCNATAITCGQTLSGTTIDATNSGTGENQTCSVTQSYPGVWYSVAGNGNVMTASLCGTAWDSKISVFSGTCASLNCVGGNDDGGPACTGTSASYSWTSVAGTNYYILVHGYSSNSAFNIALTCTVPATPPINDLCANATALPCATIALEGSTVNCASETAPGGYSSDYGVWYTFTGDGNPTTISSTAIFDHEMDFFTGSCGSLTNIAAIDNSLGLETYTFTSILGTQYYVYIAYYLGGSTTTGTFTIDRTCVPPPDYRAQFISMNTGSADWCAGEIRNITVNIKNTGTLPWTDGSGRDFNVGVKWNTNGTSWSDFNVRVDAQGLTPGNTATYTLSLKAADFITGGAYGSDLATGSNNISFDIVSEGCFWFGSNTTNACGVCSGNAVYTSAPQIINGLPVVNAGADAIICQSQSVSLAGTSTPVQAFYSLTTTSAGGNGCYGGAMFNISTNTNTITLQGFGLIPEITSSQNVNVYYKSGTYVGFETNSIAWTLIGTYSINGTTGVISNINITPLTIPASSVYGIYLNYDASYTDGSNTYSDANITVNTGVGLCGAFSSTNANRTFNGIINYSINSTLTYSWNPLLYLSSSSILNPTANPNTTTTYVLTTTSSSGCSATDNVLVTVNTPTVSQTPATGDFIWNGSISNVWETSSNWYTYSAGSYMSAGSTLPSSTTNVIIPANGNCVLAQPTAINTNSVQNVRIESNAILTMNSQGIINVKSNWLNNGTANLAGAINFNGTTNISGSGINNFDNLTVSTGSSITMASGIINIAGDWLNNGSTLFSGGLLNFNGTSFQNISGAVVPTFKNLTVSNTNGIVIDNNINIYGTLLLSNGPIDIKGSIVNLGSSGLLSGETSVKRVFSTDGGGMEPAGTGVIRATININTSNVSTGNIAGLGLDFTPSAPLGATIITRGCAQQVGTGGNSSILRYFDIQPGNKAIVPMLTINKFNYWGGTTDLELNGINETTLQMFQEVNYGGPTYWEPRTTTTSSVSDFISASTATVTNLSGIIRITLGSSNSPLPVELINFKAECNNNESIISWQTASEVNNRYFIIEKSNDVVNFIAYDTIVGAGNSNSLLEYFYKDVKVYNNGIKYYRLKQVDFNGTSAYSNIVQSNCSQNFEPTIVVIPNPSIEGTKIKIKGEYTNYMITDMLGRNVDCKVYDHTIVGLKAGVYIITFDNSTKIKFVVSRL